MDQQLRYRPPGSFVQRCSADIRHPRARPQIAEIGTNRRRSCCHRRGIRLPVGSRRRPCRLACQEHHWPRPAELLQTNGAFYFRPFAFHADFASFPSGHSATAGAMAMSLALVFPRLRPVFMPAGVLICLSRQWVGAHWASDTLMGWGVGVAFAFWLAHAFARRRLLFAYGSDGRLCPGERYKTVLMTLRALLRRRPAPAKKDAASLPATACPSQSNLASHTLEIQS